MSMTQVTTGTSPSGDPFCPNCHSVLPLQAAFCAFCGERITKKNVAFLMQDNAGITSRYRITSLVRRRPNVSLFFAIDNQQLRPVGIRDIDISSLSNEARTEACEILQLEYDLLRRESIDSIMPLIDLRHFQGHLYVVSGWPSRSGARQRVTNTHLHTLQDVLQSGIGLPDTHVSLFWIEQICFSLEKLHCQRIVLGDLDPQALILGTNNFNSELLLLVSWMPPLIRSLLPRASVVNNSSNFSAPEVLLGKPEPRSDIYSLGAVLYLLLTGIPPEEPMVRMHRSLPSPVEVNARINGRLDEFVMKALSIESSERFRNAGEMAEALSRIRLGSKRAVSRISSALPPITEMYLEDPRVGKAAAKERQIEEIVNTDTVHITPLPEVNLSAWKTANLPISNATSPQEQSPQVFEGAVEQVIAADSSHQNNSRKTSHSLEVSSEVSSSEDDAMSVFPSSGTSSLLKRLQRLILGEQKHSTTAAAIIETPMRVQPDQPFTIRIQLMGRDVPGTVNPQERFLRSDSRKNLPVGLSALIEGEIVLIEIRSALYQNFAYIVQQTPVQIPANGYAAEVTIPMHPLSNGTSGRRERLHIFFMDEMRRPLYEKPFIVELFISYLVQPGREGHNVLTIPI
jgi:serine/threonine protein kinase